MLQNPELHYLDNAATTIVAPEVADVIDKAMREHWANPSSLYAPGARSEEALNAARAAVARTLGCKSKELYFTSCGSEGNNLALLGAAQTRTFGKGIVVSGFEHPSVQRPLERLAAQGYHVTVVARPGTENLPYAMGLAAAATRLAGSIRSRDKAMRALNDRLRAGLSIFPEVEINSPAGAVPEVLNFSENCIKSETMLAWLSEKQIYVSSASACGRGQPSHTLAAMGRDPLAIDTAIRVSFCADNTPEDVDAFLERFEDGMKHLQRIRK